MTAPGRLPLVLGNWKSNLDHEQGIHLVQKLAWTLRDAHFDAATTEVGVAPPFTALRSVQTLLDSDAVAISLAAQDVSADAEGAHTGEVAASMLAKLGCRYVLVGHSERRAAGETDDAVAAKTRRVLAAAMIPVVCVGEPLEIREAGGHVEHVLAQLTAALTGLPAGQVGSLVLAYEPVWAIGTGRTATPDDAQSMAAAIRGRLVELFGEGPADRVRILYGGSVKTGNVASLLDGPDVDGALVGGASLDPVEFAGICRFRTLPRVGV
jgi:triosephosphate isomerase